jgi:hypothetical protein
MSSSGVSFNSSIRVVNADDTVYIRHMNPDGGFYDAETCRYEEDDSLSINLDVSQTDEDGTSFLDAVQDFANGDAANQSASVADNSLSPLSATEDFIGGMGDYSYNSSGYDKTTGFARVELSLNLYPHHAHVFQCHERFDAIRRCLPSTL